MSCFAYRKSGIPDIFTGSFYVPGKLPTYPSLKPTFCPNWEQSVNISLGEGYVRSFPETYVFTFL